MADGYANRLNADPVDGTPQYPALAERLFGALALMPDTSALRARPGRRLGAGLELAVAADGLTATVQPGVCVVPAPDATSGPYVVAIPTAVTLTLPAKPGSGLQRRDRVVVRVYDEEIAALGTTLRESRVELVTGTAAASPSAPALPLMAYEVGQLNSTSTATTLYSTNLARTWSAGGVGVVYSQAERDALTAYDGLVVYREDLGYHEHRAGGAWSRLVPAQPPASGVLAANAANGGGTGAFVSVGTSSAVTLETLTVPDSGGRKCLLVARVGQVDTNTYVEYSFTNTPIVDYRTPWSGGVVAVNNSIVEPIGVVSGSKTITAKAIAGAACRARCSMTVYVY